MSTRRACIATLAAVVISAPATAVVWRADADPAKLLELGAKFDAVGQVDRGGNATLIASNWAITAAHVAQGLDATHTLRFGGHDYPIKRVVIHPEGAADPEHPRRPPEIDLALIELAEPVTGITPLLPYRGADEQDKRVLIVGLGDFGPAGGPFTHGDGRRRAVENRVADAGPKRLFLPFDAPGETDKKALKLEGIGAAGDSGGPALLLVGSAWQVAGVSSGGDGPPGAYGTTDIYTRVSGQFAWIEGVAGAFHEAEIVSQVVPNWPRHAKEFGTEGFVVVEGLIGLDGKVSKMKVVESRPGNVFNGAALQSFASWTFKPRVESGVAVARRAQYRIEFK